MKLACPHCSQPLELTPDVLASLQGQPHFECPSCQGLIATPEQPRRPSASARAKANGRVQQGMNRNFLVLGIAALVALGGVAAFLASRNGGSITNIFQNTTNNIIHNSYFTQLIAGGATTLEDLKSIEEIRPYGDGFIGISKAQLNWPQAIDLAKRTSSEVLAVEDSATGTRQQLVEWLKTTFAAQFQPTLWVRQDGQTKVTDGNDVLVAASLESARKVALHWRPNTGRTTSDPALATKEQPFVNSLGMRFVPVPGTKVLFCVHETRRQDYAAYADNNPNADGRWRAPFERGGVPVGDGKTHPVIGVNWHDANDYCAWLSRRESRKYRLPTDAEWSAAVGIAEQEARSPGATPEQLNDKIPGLFPWGYEWPPKTPVENLSDSATQKAGIRTNNGYIGGGYSDGFPTTAPVMSFPPNRLGIYDLGANVLEACLDERKDKGLVIGRGGCWDNCEYPWLLSSHRHFGPPNNRVDYAGFRVVLETSNSVPNTSARSPGVEKALELISRLGGSFEEEGSPAGPKTVIRVSLAGNQKVTDDELLQLAALNQLRELNINSTTQAITDKGLTVLSAIPELTRLDLGHTFALSEKGLEHLAGLRSLVSLKLQESAIVAKGDGLVHLKNLVALRELNLAYSILLEDRNLAALTSLPRLAKLDLKRCEKLTDAALDHVALMPSLEELDLSGTKVTDAGLLKLGALKQLKHLTLSGAHPSLRTTVTDAGVVALQTALPSVKISR